MALQRTRRVYEYHRNDGTDGTGRTVPLTVRRSTNQQGGPGLSIGVRPLCCALFVCVLFAYSYFRRCARQRVQIAGLHRFRYYYHFFVRRAHFLALYCCCSILRRSDASLTVLVYPFYGHVLDSCFYAALVELTCSGTCPQLRWVRDCGNKARVDYTCIFAQFKRGCRDSAKVGYKQVACDSFFLYIKFSNTQVGMDAFDCANAPAAVGNGSDSRLLPWF